ncbi:MAG: hypothetical protein Q8M95_14265 [Candidatus Methanoperedens sp.]|nr:hypothetical protein [Candidatus Methanoperedens sp.]
MLETREERVKLLKAGFSGKMIERLFIEGNNLRISRIPPVIQIVELEIPKAENSCIRHQALARCA